MDYMVGQLEALLSIPSPSGFCRDALRVLNAELGQLGFTAESLAKGGLIITVPGADPAKTVGVSAHVDTLGAMVRSIKSSGTLRMTSVGGYMMGSIENEYCTIHTRSGKTYSGTILTTKPSVHVYPEARELKREEAVMEVRIDEDVASKEDVEQLGIGVGDFVSFDPRTKVLPNGWIKSRHLDNKAGVAVILGLLEWLNRTKTVPAYTLKLIITAYEEVGHGAAYIPSDISELLAIDMGAIGDDLQCTEKDVSICAKDSSGPYDYDMVSCLIELAKRESLSYAVDIYPQYGSDASAALRGGNNIRAALIGPGVHASHAMERTHRDALHQTAALLAAYVTAV
ncbi:M42 family metallopeptidase [Paenibacillus turpanensis]|uniref:M42 family metallopeptidase n=1 Tax=Paenibacillus turpanensis TaxID=2689078 RepID=UPI00140D61AD|nr:M42 family metallopeptidase [Paenibacillus turpanensis]